MAIEYTRVGDATIAYETLGEDGPPVIYLAEAVSNLAMIDTLPQAARFFERLSRFCRLTRFDRRGTGLSDQAQVAAFQDYVDDVEALRLAIGEEQVHLLGSGQGGQVALAYAAQYPEHVRKVIVANTTVGNVIDPEKAPTPDNTFSGVLQVDMAFFEQDPGKAMQLLADVTFPDGPTDIRKWYASYLRACLRPRGLQHWFARVLQQDLRDSLPQVRASTLILYVTEVAGLAFEALPAHAAYMLQHIPEAQSIKLVGVAPLLYAREETAVQTLSLTEEFFTGTIQHSADRRFVVVLFTDIVESTAQQQERGDRGWRDLLARYEAETTLIVNQYNGWVVKFQGDGVMACFELLSTGLRAALALVRNATEFGVEIRAGLNAGEAFIVGDDLYGGCINLAARVSAAAGPSEILVSQAASRLVDGSQFSFAPIGERDLKGIGPTEIVRLES